jgi:starch-binding outer membrane protein, SusD/RagB family
MIKKYDMKKFNKIILFLILSAFSLVGCNDMLDVDSNRIVTPGQYTMDAANDTLYSMFAVYAQLQKIADSYVLLGELRGDLMDVSSTSDLALKEINNFDISANNKYANNIKDYYSVINNCNYIIHNIDTSLVKASVKVMQKEYAACKAIRAWTYMQIALNYGSAIYYDKPILSVQDGEEMQNSTPLTLAELAPILIADILPFKDVMKPKLGTIFRDNLDDTFFPIRFILGDLYLWTGQYENAANEYHDLIVKNRYALYSRNQYEVINHVFTGNWTSNLSFLNSSDIITNIAATNQYGQTFDLDSLTLNRMIIPSDLSIANWKKQMYYAEYNRTTKIHLTKFGDLRIADYVITSNAPKLSYSNNSYAYSGFLAFDSTATTLNKYLGKYFDLNLPAKDKKTNKTIVPYRVPLLYLRYAEAVNRLGKPNLALAVLKNGLNSATLANGGIIPASEIGSSLPNYMDFSMFNFNIGVRMRGCGNVDVDSVFYKIPGQVKLEAMNSDSIKYVEDLIVNELALESAFEGNRFHDLMRVAIRRNDNFYLANIVAAKHTANKEAIKSKLSLSREYWYLKK